MGEIENVYIRIVLKTIKMFRILFSLLFVSLSFAQQTDKVDFIKCDASVSPNASEKSINGDVFYEFKVKKTIDTIKIDAKYMEFSRVMINGKSVKFKNSGKTLDLFDNYISNRSNLDSAGLTAIRSFLYQLPAFFPYERIRIPFHGP